MSKFYAMAMAMNACWLRIGCDGGAELRFQIAKCQNRSKPEPQQGGEGRRRTQPRAARAFRDSSSNCAISIGLKRWQWSPSWPERTMEWFGS